MCPLHDDIGYHPLPDRDVVIAANSKKTSQQNPCRNTSAETHLARTTPSEVADVLEKLALYSNRFSEWCHKFGTLVILPAMAILITYSVGMRYIFNAPNIWGEELNGLLLFLLLFLSLTYAWDTNKHIRMELVYVKLSPKWRAVADFATSVTGIIFFGLMGIQSFRDIGYMIRTNESGEELGIPLWPFRVVMATIAFIFVFKLVAYLFQKRDYSAHGHKTTEIEGVVIDRENR